METVKIFMNARFGKSASCLWRRRSYISADSGENAEGGFCGIIEMRHN
jgi:hypothetical protein